MQPPCPRCGGDLFEGTARAALYRDLEDGDLHTKQYVTCDRCKARLMNKDDGPWDVIPA